MVNAVFTPALSAEVAVTPLLHGQQFPVIFEQAGRMAFSSSYIHVLLPLNITTLQEAIDSASNAIGNSTKHAYEKTKSGYGHFHPRSRELEFLFNPYGDSQIIGPLSRLKQIKDDFDQLCALLPESKGFAIDKSLFEQTHAIRPLARLRKKRAAFLASLMSKAIGTFWGFLGRSSIKTLMSSVASGSMVPNVLMNTGIVSAGRQILTSIPSMIGSLMKNLNYAQGLNYYPSKSDIYPIINEIISDVQLKVSKYVHVLQQLHNHRLAVDWLSKKDVETMHTAINTYASANNLSPLTSSPTDYFQLDVSYVREGKDITIILHVPCASGSELLSLLRYIPAPIPLSKLHGPSLSIGQTIDHSPLANQFNESFQEALFIQPPEEFIAIGARGGYKTLTSEELTECSHKNRIYVCDKPNFVNTKLFNTCIGSLYDKNEKGVMKHCKFYKKPLMETVFQVGYNTFIVFSPEQFTARFSCPSGSSTANIAYANRITLEAGCSLELLDHTLQSSNHFAVHTITEVSTWDWNPLESPASALNDFHHVVEQVHHLQYNGSAFKSRIDDHFARDFLPDGSPLEISVLSLVSLAGVLLASALVALIVFLRTYIRNKYFRWLRGVAETQLGQPREDRVEEHVLLRAQQVPPVAGPRAERGRPEQVAPQHFHMYPTPVPDQRIASP